MHTQHAEVERVAHHIARAEGHAARADVSRLGHLQRLLRQLLLAELAHYRAAGQFPINRDFTDRTPYFVDAGGTCCAMAHLLEVGGEGDLVARIARERNHARIRELVSEPRLLAWLEAAGLSVAEAAAIQPAYCSQATDCICGGDFSFPEYPVPAAGVLEGVVLASGKARVDHIYGVPLGVSVGDEILLSRPFQPGERILAPIDSISPGSYGAIRVEIDGQIHCSSQGVSMTPDLDVEQFTQAVLAADCAAELRSQDPAWRERPGCEGGPGGGPGHGEGCSSGADVEAASVGILLALVAVLVRRPVGASPNR